MSQIQNSGHTPFSAIWKVFNYARLLRIMMSWFLYGIRRRAWWWCWLRRWYQNHHRHAEGVSLLCGILDHHNMRKDGKFFLCICCIAIVQKQIESTRKRTYVNNNWRKKIQWLKVYIRWTPFFLRSNEKGKKRSEGKMFSSSFFRDLYFSTQEPYYYISFSRRLQHSALASLYDNVSVRCV